jgi:hypothetical protein
MILLASHTADDCDACANVRLRLHVQIPSATGSYYLMTHPACLYVSDNIIICLSLTAGCPSRAQDAVFLISSEYVRRCPGRSKMAWRAERGGFDRRIFLEYVDQDRDDPLLLLAAEW